MTVLKKALKTTEETLKEELQVSEEVLYERVWEAIKKEGFELNFKEFVSEIKNELQKRNWDISKFRDSKNQPITNVFKSLLKQFIKNSGLQMSNDAISNILNCVRKQYGASGVLRAGLYPPTAFRERSEWGLPYDLGDSVSCFREGGCNEGNVDWLCDEWAHYQCAYLVAFEYKRGDKKGVGRCWAYTLKDDEMKVIGIFATNFYSKGVELKNESFKYVIVRLLRRLFDMSEGVRFATGKSAPLPIYLNGDGFIIYEPSAFEHSDCVSKTIATLESHCLWCGSEVAIGDLYRYSGPVLYNGRVVKGLIVCPDCRDSLDNMVECEDCGQYIYREDAVYVEGRGYVCEQCFSEHWFYCDRCGEPERRDYAVFTPDDRVLCQECASQLGARCAICGEYHYYDDDTIHLHRLMRGGWTFLDYVCDDCAERLKKYECVKCKREVEYIEANLRFDDESREMVQLKLCDRCYQDWRIRMRHQSIDWDQLDPSERVLLEILLEEER